MTASGTHLDVRLEAHDLRLQPRELLRELVADDVPVMLVSARVYRVEAEAFELWKASRQQRCAEMFRHAERRVDFVKERRAEKRRPTFTAR